MKTKSLIFLLAGLLFFASCTPDYIDEELKLALGYNAYKPGDTLTVLKIDNTSGDTLDTIKCRVRFKDNYIFKRFMAKNREIYSLVITLRISDATILSFWIEGDKKRSFSTLNVTSDWLQITNHFDSYEINGKKFDNVYKIECSDYQSYILTSENYGFIKVYSPSTTLLFLR